MSVYKSALGKPVDMGALVAKNEKTRAVGNMKVNARGDIIDGFNKVITPVTEKVNNSYAKTIGNKSAQITQKTKPSKPIIKEDLTTHELELENNFDDDIEVEQIKARELGKK